MFSNVISPNQIPPNFLNSILTNVSLYDMFKNEYEENKSYFQDLEKEEYLQAMLTFIETALFSSNLYNIYSEPEDIDGVTKGKLNYIKSFYDDFLLEKFRIDPPSILKTKFFQGMVFAKENDLYASKSREFNDLFEYVFDKSLDYDDIVDILIKEPVGKLANDEPLTVKEFDCLCNYVKNNTSGFVDMDIVTKMLKNHAYKTNHIFDAEVVESLVRSTAKSYLERWNIPVYIEFTVEDEDDEEDGEANINRIVLSEKLIEKFLSLNYTEIFTELFFSLDLLKNRVLLKRNEVSYETLKTIMDAVVNHADPLRIVDDENYTPNEYIADLSASSFVKCLRFFQTFGVNLFENYIESGLNRFRDDLRDESVEKYSLKEVSIDQRFEKMFEKDDKKELIKHFAVLNILFDKEGKVLNTMELIKKWMKTEYADFIEEYLHSRIISPEAMIDDVQTLTEYRPKDEKIKEFIERELKYIYVDSFYYSLDSVLKLKLNGKFDREEYLMDLAVKVNCLKDTPLTHRFIDEAIFTIEDMKQSE